MRNARGVSDRLDTQYRDCDGYLVEGDRRRCPCFAFALQNSGITNARHGG